MTGSIIETRQSLVCLGLQNSLNHRPNQFDLESGPTKFSRQVSSEFAENRQIVNPMHHFMHHKPRFGEIYGVFYSNNAPPCYSLIISASQ